MADQWNDNMPAVGNQISADLPDIEENMGWIQRLLQMCIGYKTSTIANVSPPGEQRAKFSWKDGDEIYIDPGRYFHDGTTRQLVFWDAQITFVLQSAGSNLASDDYGADGWHYIYLDDSAIITQASPELDADCFLNETTAPTWSNTKHGWYKGSDRCIFAVYETGGAILEFLHDGGETVFFADAITDGATVDIDTSWTDETLTIPGFSIRAIITATGNYQDGTSTFSWRTNGQTAGNGHWLTYAAVGATKIFNSTEVITDSTQKIELIAGTSNANTITIKTDAWKFPIGM